MMKKLVIILLAGIYSVAIFGAGAVSYDCDCCEKKSGTLSLPINNDNDCCDNVHASIVFGNSYIAAPVPHFTSRKFYNAQYTSLPAFIIAANDQHSYLHSVNSNAAPPSLVVPVYILHCVFRI